jgi:hypothetical protein
VPDTRSTPKLTGNTPLQAATVIDPKVTRGTPAAGFDPKTSVEQPADRTATTRTFRNRDGTRTLRLYDGQANVRRPAGSWSPVDLTLATNTTGLAPKNAPHHVSFTRTGSAAELATVDVDAGHRVAFGLAGATAATAVPHGDTATYRGVRAGTDLTLTATRSGVRENLVLSSRTAAESYVYPLRLTGLTPVLDHGAVRLTDTTGATRATIPSGLMTDAHGATSAAVHYALARTATGWNLTVTLDRAWLADPHRAYPVTVDPSVQIDTDSDDTYVRSGLGDESAAPDLQIGQTGSGIARSYLHFGNLYPTLKNKYVDGASLVVDDIDAHDCTATPVTLFRVASGWSGGGLRWPGAFGESAPQRVLDTRTSLGGHQRKVTAGEAVTVPVRGVAGVPADATAVAVNLTGTGATVADNLSVYGQNPSSSSTLNIDPAEDRANMSITAIGDDGAIHVHNASGQIEVLVDIVGWFAPGSAGSRYYALPQPVRMLETRSGIGLRHSPLAAGDVVDVRVGGLSGVPYTATGVLLNGAGILPTANGFLTVWSADQPYPGLSSLNEMTGAVTANATLPQLGSSGQVAIRNSAGSGNVLADVEGYFVH